jgi:fructose PTS system EIIBC or EIIC component
VVFFAITGFFTWLIAILIGTVVGAAAVIVAKSIGRRTAEADVPEDAVDLAHAHSPEHSPARAATA